MMEHFIDELSPSNSFENQKRDHVLLMEFMEWWRGRVLPGPSREYAEAKIDAFFKERERK